MSGKLNYLTRLENFPLDDLQDFIKKGKSSIIPEDLQLYFRKIKTAYFLWDSGKKRIHIQRELLATFPEMGTIQTANNYINDAVHFFNLGKTIDSRAIIRYRLDKMHELYVYALKHKEFETARRINLDIININLQLEQEKEIPEELLQPRDIVIVPYRAEDFGFEKRNLKEIAKQFNDEIDSYDIPAHEKIKLKKEANIIDIEHEEA